MMLGGFEIAVIQLLVVVLIIVAMWKVFEKAGYDGWKSLIPIYNAYIMVKIAGKPGYWLLLFCIPLVNIIFLVWTYNLISIKFGKGVGFTIGLIFLPYIFWPILGFGDAQYQGEENGLYEESNILDKNL